MPNQIDKHNFIVRCIGAVFAIAIFYAVKKLLLPDLSLLEDPGQMVMYLEIAALTCAITAIILHEVKGIGKDMTEGDHDNADSGRHSDPIKIILCLFVSLGFSVFLYLSTLTVVYLLST